MIPKENAIPKEEKSYIMHYPDGKEMPKLDYDLRSIDIKEGKANVSRICKSDPFYARRRTQKGN